VFAGDGFVFVAVRLETQRSCIEPQEPHARRLHCGTQRLECRIRWRGRWQRQQADHRAHRRQVVARGVCGDFGKRLPQRLARDRRTQSGRIAAGLLLALSVAGVLFSIYLTYLEVFVIGAVCAWCLTSALIVAAETILAARIAGWRLPAAPALPGSL